MINGAFLSVIIACFLWGSFAGSKMLFDRQSKYAPCIEKGINPNTAPLGSLIRLNGVGIKRAQAIIEYRLSNGPGEVFRQASDLQAISGIGPVTVEKNRDNLRFE